MIQAVPTGAPVSPQDVSELGRALASNNDWRAIALVLIFVIVVLVIERWLSGWRQSVERKQLLELAQKFGENSDKVADALNGLRQEIAVMSAVSSRMEATAGVARDSPKG